MYLYQLHFYIRYIFSIYLHGAHLYLHFLHFLFVTFKTFEYLSESNVEIGANIDLCGHIPI